MVGRHRFPTRRQLRAAMVEIVDIYTLTTHLVTPDNAATPGAWGHLALCGADVTPAVFTRPPGNGRCESCRASLPTQRSGKTRLAPQHGGGADHG